MTRLSRLSVDQFADRLATVRDLVVVDVRNPGERALGMIPGAIAIGLPELLRRLGELDPTKPTVVHCAGGYRSAIASSLLRAHQFTDVSDILGGFDAWAAREVPTTLPAIDAADVDTADTVLVDVREDEEWDAGHIEGALHIPMSRLADRLGELPPGRLTIVCRSGNRSGKVTTWLLGRGVDAVNMAGGMLAWSAAGRPMRDTEGTPGVVV